MPNIIAVSNPISRERFTATVPGGKSLHETMKIPDDVVIDFNGGSYNGEPLQADDVITLIRVPKGGEGGKDRARTGIVLAAAIASQFIFPGNPSLAAGISLKAALGRAVFTYGVRLLANSMIPPEGK